MASVAVTITSAWVVDSVQAVGDAEEEPSVQQSVALCLAVLAVSELAIVELLWLVCLT